MKTKDLVAYLDRWIVHVDLPYSERAIIREIKERLYALDKEARATKRRLSGKLK